MGCARVARDWMGCARVAGDWMGCEGLDGLWGDRNRGSSRTVGFIGFQAVGLWDRVGNHRLWRGSFFIVPHRF